MTTPIRKAFDAARAFRATVPLPSGRFKLDEAIWQIQRMRSDIEKIRQVVCKRDAKAAKAALVSISPDERAHLIKRTPRHVADILGKYILPGIAELTADGVPQRDVAALMKHADAEASKILAAAEEARSRLKAGIKTEYDAMRGGGSHVTQLLDDAERLAASVMNRV
jgi:alpha-D-ribose 1-methylphosphonate 5-triphosphate diphosphatase PhnM